MAPRHRVWYVPGWDWVLSKCAYLNLDFEDLLGLHHLTVETLQAFVHFNFGSFDVGAHVFKFEAF